MICLENLYRYIESAVRPEHHMLHFRVHGRHFAIEQQRNLNSSLKVMDKWMKMSE